MNSFCIRIRLRRPEGPSLGSVEVRCRCIVPKVGCGGYLILGQRIDPRKLKNFASGGCPALSYTPIVGDCNASLGLAFGVLLAFGLAFGSRVHARTSFPCGFFTVL